MKRFFDYLATCIYSTLLIASFFSNYAAAENVHTCEDSLKIMIGNAFSQITITKFYDPSYVKISYPGGDIPMERGVCTDVIIRAFRSVDIDLQKLIHEDMKNHFQMYPHKWGLKCPDTNIDHRRVPNVATWLKRNGKELPVTGNGNDFEPGDIVTWDLGNNIEHIGLISDKIIEKTGQYAIIHNIGRGAELEDMLFAYKLTGHFRFFCMYR